MKLLFCLPLPIETFFWTNRRLNTSRVKHSLSLSHVSNTSIPLPFSLFTSDALGVEHHRICFDRRERRSERRPRSFVVLLRRHLHRRVARRLALLRPVRTGVREEGKNERRRRVLPLRPRKTIRRRRRVRASKRRPCEHLLVEQRRRPSWTCNRDLRLRAAGDVDAATRLRRSHLSSSLCEAVFEFLF